MGPGGAPPPGLPKPGQAAWATSAAGIHDTTSGTAFCLFSVAVCDLSASFIVYFLNIYNIVSLHLQPVCTEAFPGFCSEACNI